MATMLATRSLRGLTTRTTRSKAGLTKHGQSERPLVKVVSWSLVISVLHYGDSGIVAESHNTKTLGVASVQGQRAIRINYNCLFWGARS